MNQYFAPTVVSPTTGRVDVRWLVVSAVGLPAAIAGVNYAILGRIVNAPERTLETCLQFGWYVVQVGIVGYVVGRGRTQPVLKWVVFGWVLLLVNLLAVTLAMNPSLWSRPACHLPPAAMFAGQIGLCIVWAFFGDMRWQARWPAMMLAAAGIFSVWLAFRNDDSRKLWTELIVLQVITLSILCALLRLKGYHLRRIATAETAATAEASKHSLQFSLKHVLIWTTALSIVLGIANSLNLFNWQAVQQMARLGMLWKLTVATTAAIVIVVALWVALGRGHWLARPTVGLLFVVLVGSGLSFWSVHNAAAMSTFMLGRWSADAWELRGWYEVGWWWLGWLFLSGGVLAATLVILRALGYRLVRTPAGSTN